MTVDIVDYIMTLKCILPLGRSYIIKSKVEQNNFCITNFILTKSISYLTISYPMTESETTVRDTYVHESIEAGHTKSMD